MADVSLTDSDLQDIQERGISREENNQQIDWFHSGFPSMKLVKPAVIGDGIIKIQEADIEKYIEIFDSGKEERSIVKFVPASGAASRMFKALFSFAASYDQSETAYKELTKDGEKNPVFQFLKRLDEFPFYNDLKEQLEKEGIHLEESLLKRDYKSIIDGLLSEEGLNYGNLPKGLLPFHQYDDGSVRTPVEEHMVEGIRYARESDGTVRIHFTVSPEHQQLFDELIAKLAPAYEKEYDVSFDITFSRQDPSTDTIAVDMTNRPFRLANGQLLFRPGGHGALIRNLNAIDADIIFIKNIDNVVPDAIKDTTFTYKKILGGVLIHYQELIFDLLRKLKKPEKLNLRLADQAMDLLEDQLCVYPADKHENREETNEYLISKLNRPIRICGMVKNEGEPGGGPFWTQNPDYSISLQIVESAQIDQSIPTQNKIVEQSTHFNPVDIVCGVKDFEGNKFDLEKYVDPRAGFISQKSLDGKDLKAQELPGLWNGSMSDWITIFVEVPKITFNPVKTVNDLLRPEHQHVKVME